MQPDPKINCVGAPVVRLAGREWFVPVLALRQTRVVAPAFMRLLPTLSALQNAAGGDVGAVLETRHLDALMEAVHAALTRAYPDLSLDAFLDLEASLNELVAAVPVIAKQTGLFHPADEKTESALGEREGEKNSPISIVS